MNKEEFLKKIETGISIVDFHANWCGPCKAFAPTFEKFEKEFSDKADFLKIDIDKVPQVASDYSVMSIPTLIVFKDGVEVERRTGMMNEILFRIWVNSIIG